MKKRNKYFLKEKEFIRLKKELEKNQCARHNLGWIELSEPRFNGWVAKLETRQDIKNRQDSWIFEGIIELFGTTSFAKKINQFEWNNCDKRNRWIVYNRPRIRGIDQSKYDTLVPQAKKYFTLDTYVSTSSWRGNWYYCTVPSFYYDIVYHKDYITKVKICDSILDQEKSELEYVIERNFYNYNSRYNAPKRFRRVLNKIQRAKAKSTLYKNWKNGYEIEYEDNYRGADWLYW